MQRFSSRPYCKKYLNIDAYYQIDPGQILTYEKNILHNDDNHYEIRENYQK